MTERSPDSKTLYFFCESLNTRRATEFGSLIVMQLKQILISVDHTQWELNWSLRLKYQNCEEWHWDKFSLVLSGTQQRWQHSADAENSIISKYTRTGISSRSVKLTTHFHQWRPEIALSFVSIFRQTYSFTKLYLVYEYLQMLDCRYQRIKST
jgi:hypothetical protein